MLLQLSNIGFQINGQFLFRNVDVNIQNGERIALAGPNGSGKSTLLKMIAGQLEPDEGERHYSRQATVGYLPQDLQTVESNISLFEETKSAFDELLNHQEDLEELHRRIEEAEDEEQQQKLLSKYGHMQEELEQTDYYAIDAKVKATLTGLGFSHEDMERPISEFSGGWQMRMVLAKLLLQQPNMLLLDEPTNHLDIDTVVWLEQFLKRYPGTIILVSHDRTILNRLTGRTLALHQNKIKDYPGNYAYYEKAWETELEQLRKEYENQQDEIKRMQEFIDRFRYKSHKAKLVQSRIKQLEKMEKIELPDNEDEIGFHFPPSPRSGAVPLRMEQVSKHYDELTVFDSLDFNMDRGDKIAIVGPNGAGKSTFAKLTAGLISKDNGKIEYGHNIQLSYFAQHQAEELKREDTVFESIQRVHGGYSDTELRTLLGGFLFQEDDVFKKVDVLSGGEKSRLALARMLTSPANLLIMDEPTNHLDMASKKRLRDALQEFGGAFLVISHDRSFLDPIVNKVLEIRDGKARVFHGNVSYYLSKREEELQQQSEEQQADAQQRKEATKDTSSARDNGEGLSRKEQRRKEAEKRQAKNNALKPLQKEMQPLEQKIEKIEKELKQLHAQMEDPEIYEGEGNIQELSIKYNGLQDELNECYERWEELAEQMSEIEEQYD